MAAEANSLSDQKMESAKFVRGQVVGKFRQEQVDLSAKEANHISSLMVELSVPMRKPTSR